MQNTTILPSPRDVARDRVLLVGSLLCTGLLVAALIAHTGHTPVSDTSSLADEPEPVLVTAPVSPSLGALLANPDSFLQPPMRHPLLGRIAPEFELSDHRGVRRSLRGQTARGPVVVVFYYGYVCKHCAGQLFALDQEIAGFHELGAEVLAISADATEGTAERFPEFGEFGYPILSDPGNQVARAYQLFSPATEGKGEYLQHGTFVIARDGTVKWSHFGDEPFSDVRTLLYELALLEGRLPRAVP